MEPQRRRSWQSVYVNTADESTAARKKATRASSWLGRALSTKATCSTCVWKTSLTLTRLGGSPMTT